MNQKTRSQRSLAGQLCLPLAMLVALCWATVAAAQGKSLTLEALKVGLDTVWVLCAAFLVFFMNAGFGLLETGFGRQKNAVNSLAKHLIVFALATMAYWAVGFGLMFADGTAVLGMNGWFLTGIDNSPATGSAYRGVFSALNWTGVPLQAKFLFQLMFAGTAATIVSGAVAERLRFGSFLLFSLVLTGLLYPIVGHWVWGGGWLSQFTDVGFWDFAGSTVVHSVGGWAALMGTALLGPRFGRYPTRGPSVMPGHNMSVATLGCFILWLGWFGFNAGSTMAVNPISIAHIAVTTNTAAAVGGVAATLIAWKSLGKPKLSIMIHGILAGLVGITASCAWVTTPAAAVIGAIAGALVVGSITCLDRLKVDDPVGAVSVHLVCGIWGTLAVGLFAVGKGQFYGNIGPAAGLLVGGGWTQLWPQIVGVLSVGGFTIMGSTLAWLGIQAIAGLRVPEETEIQGLDRGEHGMEAYSGFLKEDGR